MKDKLKKIYFMIERFFLGFKRKKDVLFVARNELTFDYTYIIYKHLTGDERLRVWFCLVSPKNFLDYAQIKKKFKLRTIAYEIARKLKWDLVMLPDHGPYFRDDCPKIYVNHGISSGKSKKGEHYIYSDRARGNDGRILYEKIFLTSNTLKEQVREHYPDFHECIAVVGSLCADEMMEVDRMAVRRDKLAGLGLSPEKKTAFIASSWGPHCLIQSEGERLIEEVNKLREEYNIILSIHLHNFHVESHYKGLDMKVLLGKLRKDNVCVLEPKQSTHLLLPFSDILLTDMTSLSLYYPLLKRPVVFYDNRDVKYALSGLVPELREISFSVDDVSGLSSKFRKAEEEFDPAVMEEFSKKVFSFQGQAWERVSEEIHEILGLDHPVEGSTVSSHEATVLL
ncbi:MAG: CDP-glycerol glycerophosphotransferase family protein [Candidatus Omnitrophica bacterium]|nr:CDP-glycerol glycerophosphotransferase family protein [Candidatus Omnitrophota bacterium]